MSESTMNFRCPECGACTEVIKEGRTVGTQCTNCNWSVVTTYIPPIEQDAVIYTVRIASGNPHNQQQIKLIAQLADCNFLQARKLMQEKETAVFQGRASQILAVKQSLMNANFSVSIEPYFKW
jgi:DNA-directed RNA polymerase subunit RPC12/RpoP